MLQNQPKSRWRRPCWLAPLAALASAGCAAPDAGPALRLRLAGAQIATELVESWLSAAPRGRFRTERVQPVYLSQHGFDHLRDRACDVACVDRRVTPRELSEFAGEPIEGQRIAFYGFGLYVNRQNPLDSIFAGHLKLLFQRTLVDWNELGAGDGPIRLCGPQKPTRGGTVLMRQARILVASPTWEAMDSDAEIIAAVAADPLALGFAGLGRDGGDVRYVGLRMQRSGAPVLPSLEAIESERYGLAKVLYVYFRSPATEACQAMIDFLLSDAGRRAIESTNVWPVDPRRARLSRP